MGWNTLQRRGAACAAVAVVISCGAVTVTAEAPMSRYPVATSATLVLAQQDRSKSQSSSYRLRPGSTAKLVKLGIGGVALLVAGGAWVAKKVTGGGDGAEGSENPFGPDAQNRR